MFFLERFYPKYASIYEGESVTFHCVTERKIRWIFSNGPIYNNSMQMYTDGVHKLTLKRVGKHNEGTYRCEDNKKWSEFNSEGVLQVTGKI